MREFCALRRVAQRALEQRLIFINNLAIRRATEELRVASDFNQLCRILEAAFNSNDFDAFELRLLRPADALVGPQVLRIVSDEQVDFRWKRPGSRFSKETIPAWSLALGLVAANNHLRGSLILHRLYCGGNLQLDVNLLTSAFPEALADALERIEDRALEVAASHVKQTPIVEARAS